MYVFDLFVIFRIERVDVSDTDMKYILVATVHKMASTMDAPPIMFVGAAIQRVHALQYTGHMNARLTTPHTDCGISHLLRELESLRDTTNVK